MTAAAEVEADVVAIERLQRQYAQLNDAARWHELAALFAEDGHFSRPSDPRPVVGRAQILQAFLARPPGPPRRHLVANPQVRLLDADIAEARCYSVLLVPASGTEGTVSVGGFDDRLVRTAEGWRFQARSGFVLFDPVAFSTREGAAWPGA
jgi:3-phenylpropionate/cinnamic acid dioxygenase small subunit